MQLFARKKLILIAALALILAIVSWWIAHPRELIRQDLLLAKVKDGYEQQFCKVVFPHINNCIRVKSADCPELVRSQLTPCIGDVLPGIPTLLSKEDGKKIYDEIGLCLHTKLQNELLKNYLIDTPECRRKLN